MSAFTLDKRNAKLTGVCAGFARFANLDVTLTRVVVVIATIATGGTAALVYLLAAIIAPNG